MSSDAAMQAYALLGHEQRIHLYQLSVLKLAVARLDQESSMNARIDDLMGVVSIVSILTRR